MTEHAHTSDVLKTWESLGKYQVYHRLSANIDQVFTVRLLPIQWGFNKDFNPVGSQIPA